jgi:predicted RNase H-like nuclease (RuvC/YqgF family)
MARRAGEVASEHGHKPSEGALREVGQSLHAALADPEVAELVRTGRLVTAVSYSGMGPAGMTVVGGASRSTGATKESQATEPKKKEPDNTERLAAAKADLAAAEEVERNAQKAAESARSEADEAADQVASLDARIEELRDALAQAEQERQFAHKTERTASSNLDAAERELELAHTRVEQARSAVADI